MPEAFQARVPVPVKSRSCLRPSADETKLPVAGEKKSSGTQGRGREATTRNTSAVRRLTPHKQTKNNKTMQTK